MGDPQEQWQKKVPWSIVKLEWYMTVMVNEKHSHTIHHNRRPQGWQREAGQRHRRGSM